MFCSFYRASVPILEQMATAKQKTEKSNICDSQLVLAFVDFQNIFDMVELNEM